MDREQPRGKGRSPGHASISSTAKRNGSCPRHHFQNFPELMRKLIRGSSGSAQPPAAGDRTSAEPLARIKRYLHGYLLHGHRSICINRARKKYGTVQMPGGGKGAETSPGSRCSPVPQPRVVTALRRPAGNRRREKLQTLRPARVRLPLPCKKNPPAPSCRPSAAQRRGPPARRLTVPAATRGKLRHGAARGCGQRGAAPPSPRLTPRRASQCLSPAAPGAAQPEPRSPTAPDDPRVETSSPESFPGPGSKRNKINLFPAGENPLAFRDTGAPAGS